jgi:hypothetical protein
MSDMQNQRPGEPGTSEGEAGPNETEPAVPSVEDREAAETPEGGPS